MSRLEIKSFTDHGDEWAVICPIKDENGNEVREEELIVPKDPRNAHAKAVQAHIDAGNTPANGEPSRKRRTRLRLRNDPIWSALTKYLSRELGHNVQEVRQGILDEM